MHRGDFLMYSLTICFASFVLGMLVLTAIVQHYPPKWCTNKTPVQIEYPTTFEIAYKELS